MKRLEAAAVAIGAIIVCVAIAAYDVRLGLLAFGVGLIAISIDYRRPA